MILIDTSVWIEVSRRAGAFGVEALIERGEALTCLPVIQEVLQGCVDEAHFRVAREMMFALPIVESPLTAPVFLEAVALYRTARRAGLTVRSSVDCLIAACALRNDLELLHRDRDYAQLARISQLRERSV